MKRPRIRAGGFYFSRGFAARSRALRARISPLLRPARQKFRRYCTRLDKTAMLRRLHESWGLTVLGNAKIRLRRIFRLRAVPEDGHASEESASEEELRLD